MRESLFADLPDGMADAALDRAAVAAHEATEREDQGEVGTDARPTADVLERLLHLLAGERPISRTTERLIGRKFTLLLWLIRPDAMAGYVGRALSLRDLAKLLEVSPAALVPAVRELQEATGLQNCYTRSHGRKRRGRGNGRAGCFDAATGRQRAGRGLLVGRPEGNSTEG